jgi:predicted nuclease of predicted toxin-antitoxin system
MMGFLIDANLPRWFKPWSGPGYEFADDFGQQWSDTQLWDYATAHGIVIVSKDADFAARVLRTTTGPHVIHLRVGNLTMAGYHLFVAPIWYEVCRSSAV